MAQKSLLLLVFLLGCAAPPPPPARSPASFGSTPAEYAIAAWNTAHDDSWLSPVCRWLVEAQQVELVDNMEKAPCVPARTGFSVAGCTFVSDDKLHLQVMRTAGWTIQTHERMHLAEYCATQNVDSHHADSSFWSLDPSTALHE